MPSSILNKNSEELFPVSKRNCLRNKQSVWDAKQWRLLETQLQTSGNWIFVCGGLFGFKFVGCVFCQWLAKFRPSPRCSHPFRQIFPTKRITSIRDTCNEEDHIHSFSLTLPSEDGVMRQQPRGVKMRESDSHVSLLEFEFQWYDIVVLCVSCLFGQWCFRLIWRFDDGVRRCVLISYVYMVMYTLYDISPICTQLHIIMLWVSSALAGVEVLCGRLAALS